MTVKQLERRVGTLEKRVARLERKPRSGNGGKARQVESNHKPTTKSDDTLRFAPDAQKSIDIARRAGLLAELPPEAKVRAARWRALPEEEQKRISDEFFNLKLDKSLSHVMFSGQRWCYPTPKSRFRFSGTASG